MAKLILDMDIEPALIDKIKKMAGQTNVSLAEWTENLYRKEAEEKTHSVEDDSALTTIKEGHSDWVKSLMLAKKPTADFNDKKEYSDHIMKKYGL